MAYSNSSGGTRPGRSIGKISAGRPGGAAMSGGGAGFRSAGAVSPLRQVAPSPSPSAGSTARGVPRVVPVAPKAPSTASLVGRAVGTNLAANAVNKGGAAAGKFLREYVAGNDTGVEISAALPQSEAVNWTADMGAQSYQVADTGAGITSSALGDTAGQTADFSDASSYAFSDGASGAADAVEGASTAADTATAAEGTSGSVSVPWVAGAVRAANNDPRGAAGSVAVGTVGGVVGGYFGGLGGAKVGTAVGSWLGGKIADPVINEMGRFSNKISGQHFANSTDPYGQFFNGNETTDSATETAIDLAGGPALANARDGGLGDDAQEFANIGESGDFFHDFNDQVEEVFGGSSDVIKDFGNQVEEVVGGGCFITEATMSGLGVDDDNAEPLQVLRFFRDQVLSGTPQGQAMIEEYEAIAPYVVEVVETRPDAPAIFKKLYTDFIAPSVEAVKASDYPQALQIYAEMIAAVTPFAQELLDAEMLGEDAAMVAESPQLASQATGLRQFTQGV